jgi:hypothetical protein
MPVILATQEAEIRRITVQSQPREIVLRDLISKIGLVLWLKVKALSSKPQYHKKKKMLKIKNTSLCPFVFIIR